MRADESKQRRYEELLDSPYFTQVVEANRAYVAAAVPDPAQGERDYWALSCLPGQPATLSRISIGTMETFVVLEPESDGTTEIRGFVVVVRSVLEAGFGSMARFEAEFPDLGIEVSDYRDAGDDQIRVWGGHSDLVRALWSERFGAAAHALADLLMKKKTMHWRGHSYLLADHVLGRA
jgi:hypothetical protein